MAAQNVTRIIYMVAQSVSVRHAARTTYGSVIKQCIRYTVYGIPIGTHINRIDDLLAANCLTIFNVQEQCMYILCLHTTLVNIKYLHPSTNLPTFVDMDTEKKKTTWIN